MINHRQCGLYSIDTWQIVQNCEIGSQRVCGIDRKPDTIFRRRKNRLAGLHAQYAKLRAEFNEHNIDQFREEIAAQTLQIEKYAHLTPRFIRYMVTSSALNIIAQMTDMITVKGLIDQLPA